MVTKLTFNYVKLKIITDINRWMSILRVFHVSVEGTRSHSVEIGWRPSVRTQSKNLGCEWSTHERFCMQGVRVSLLLLSYMEYSNNPPNLLCNLCLRNLLMDRGMIHESFTFIKNRNLETFNP